MWKRIFKNSQDFETADVSGNPLYQGLDRDKLPAHTAIIMDGNGRWAKGKGLLRTAGHSAGVPALKKILKTAIALNLPALTVYAFSTENWKRPETEVDYLMGLFVDYMNKEIDEMDEDNVQIRFLGRIENLPPTLQHIARSSEERLSDNTGIRFNVALNYGGQDEILRAVKEIARLTQTGEISPENVDEKLFESFLYTDGLPPVDLLIRTSGDMRISNFLLWQAAYAEFWFTDVNWPDFTPALFVQALKDFGKRGRRFGGLVNK